MVITKMQSLTDSKPLLAENFRGLFSGIKAISGRLRKQQDTLNLQIKRLEDQTDKALSLEQRSILDAMIVGKKGEGEW